MKTQIKISLGIFLALLISLTLVSALTGSIGNARMVLTANKGDTISKTILVQNINNVSINISMFPSGDLEASTKINGANFTLAPGESRNVPFTIKVDKAGTTETKINVRFISTTDKNAVGLSSQIVINTQGSSSDNPSENSSDNPATNDSQTSINTTAIGSNIKNAMSGITSMNPILLLILALGILLILLLIFLIIITRKNKFKRAVNRRV